MSIQGKNPDFQNNSELSVYNESEVWKDFKSGNKQAFSHIYANYFNILYNYGRKIVNNRDLVEDCIQDLFFELWESKEKLSNTTSIKYYLLKALRIKLFKELSKRSKFLNKNGLSDNYDFNIVSSFETDLVNEELTFEHKEKLSHVLHKLSARQKEAIFLRYFVDLSYEEIALMMSINYQSVHNLIHRAIKILRENLIIEFLYFFLLTPFM